MAGAGWAPEDYDLANAGPHDKDLHDLASEALWRGLQGRVRGRTFGAIFMGTPCETFSGARTGPPGPRALRSEAHPYGLPKGQLAPADYERARMGTLFALQSVALAHTARIAGTPWGIENPEPRDNPTSFFKLPEVVRLAAKEGVQAVDFDQCMYGSMYRKPTRILYAGVDLSGLARRCNHRPTHQFWWEGGQRRYAWAPHPPLRGKDETGAYRTKAAAAYPAALAVALASAFGASGPGAPPGEAAGPFD